MISAVIKQKDKRDKQTDEINTEECKHKKLLSYVSPRRFGNDLGHTINGSYKYVNLLSNIDNYAIMGYMIEKILKELGFAENTIRVYERLLESGSASARHIAEHISMPRPSVYDHLNILVEQGLIVEQNDDGKKVFAVSDIKNLKHLMKDKIELLETESKKLDQYVSTHQDKSAEPKIRHFKGADQVGTILNDLYWYEDTEILSVWPMKEMLAVFGSEYLEQFNRKRIRNNNAIRIVWPQDKLIDIDEYPFVGVGKKHLRDLRIAPLHMTWNMGHLIYKDKVAFVSSRKESFGFIIQSKDFAELMRAQFEVIWKGSRPIKYKQPEKDKFLETL